MVSKYMLAILVSILTVGGIVAQDDFDVPPSKEKLQERVESVRKMRLLDVLDLQGAQVEKFYAVYNPAQAAVIDRKRAMDAKASELRTAIENGADEATLRTLTEELLGAMKSFEGAIDKRHTNVRAVLTPKQFAAYMAFEALFQEELMRTVLRRARGRR